MGVRGSCSFRHRIAEHVCRPGGLSKEKNSRSGALAEQSAPKVEKTKHPERGKRRKTAGTYRTCS